MLTQKRFEILRLCATESDGLPGLRVWHLWRLKPASKRTLKWLLKQGYVHIDSYGAAVTTPAGQSIYEERLNQ